MSVQTHTCLYLPGTKFQHQGDDIPMFQNKNKLEDIKAQPAKVASSPMDIGVMRLLRLKIFPIWPCH